MNHSAALQPRDGATYEHARDAARLSEQHDRVWEAMRDGAWRSPEEIERLTGDNWASAGARLRDFRKPKFGGHYVDRRHVADGLFEYRLTIRRESLFS